MGRATAYQRNPSPAPILGAYHLGTKNVGLTFELMLYPISLLTSCVYMCAVKYSYTFYLVRAPKTLQTLQKPMDDIMKGWSSSFNPVFGAAFSTTTANNHVLKWTSTCISVLLCFWRSSLFFSLKLKIGWSEGKQCWYDERLLHFYSLKVKWDLSHVFFSVDCAFPSKYPVNYNRWFICVWVPSLILKSQIYKQNNRSLVEEKMFT